MTATHNATIDRPSEPDSTPVPAAPLRIAMADDDTTEHLLMSMAVAEAGVDAEFSFYEAGEDLLTGLRSVPCAADLPQVIILDLRMPGLSGYGVLDELQADPTLWCIPVVLLTASRRPAEREMGLERGAQLFQQKPEDFPRLVSLARGLPLLAINWVGAATPPPRRPDGLDRAPLRAVEDPPTAA